MKLISEYLKMPSTWRAVFMALGLIGVNLVPDQKEAVIGIAVALLAVVEAFRKEETK